MATPLKPAGESPDPRPPGRRGAVAAGGTEDPGRKRRGAAWLLLAALLIAAAVAGIIWAVTSSHHKSAGSAQATVGSTGSAQATAGSTGSAQATAGTTGSAQAALPPFGLVGGGGITPRDASGKLAVAGSIGDVLFAEDGTALDASAMTVITTAGQDIRQHQVTTVTVIGYTDAIGNAAANTRLSLERAQAVVAALRPLSGSGVQYQAEARGQGQPVAANSTVAGRQLNRRVVITTG